MSDGAERARELAEAFDRSFALPERVVEARGPAALAVRTGGDAYVLPLEGLSAVSRMPKVVPLPGSPPAQLGLAGVRGGLVAVFSLPALLGYEVAPTQLAWLVVTAGPRPLALGFELLEGQVAIPNEGVVASPAGGRRHVDGLVRLEGEANTRGVLDLVSMIKWLRAPGGRE